MDMRLLYLPSTSVFRGLANLSVSFRSMLLGSARAARMSKWLLMESESVLGVLGEVNFDIWSLID
jgi:hypothetical protein